jgi:hypothetical protein
MKMETAIAKRVFMRGDGLLRIYVAVTDRAWAAAWMCCQVTHPDQVCIRGFT